MCSLEKALRTIQSAVALRFGKSQDSSSGEATVYIGPAKMDVTDSHGTIVARGPVRVATILRRKRRNR